MYRPERTAYVIWFFLMNLFNGSFKCLVLKTNDVRQPFFSPTEANES